MRELTKNETKAVAGGCIIISVIGDIIGNIFNIMKPKKPRK